MLHKLRLRGALFTRHIIITYFWVVNSPGGGAVIEVGLGEFWVGAGLVLPWRGANFFERLEVWLRL